jgi:hypothetical protein
MINELLRTDTFNTWFTKTNELVTKSNTFCPVVTSGASTLTIGTVDANTTKEVTIALTGISLVAKRCHAIVNPTATIGTGVVWNCYIADGETPNLVITVANVTGVAAVVPDVTWNYIVLDSAAM